MAQSLRNLGILLLFGGLAATTSPALQQFGIAALVVGLGLTAFAWGLGRKPRNKVILAGIVIVAGVGLVYTLFTMGPLFPEPWHLNVTGPARFPALHGKSPRQVSGILGDPKFKFEFTMDKCCNEMQIELFNIFKEDDPFLKNIHIRQWKWKREDKNLVLWFHNPDDGRWIVIDSLKWPDSVEF